MKDSEILHANALFSGGKFAEAFALFKKGAAEGHTRAVFNYAYCLQYGYGTDADPAMAMKYYLYLRNEEDGDAAYNAGAMMVTGRGVPCDPKTGYALMRLAAELGCPEAQLYMAMVSLTGCVGEPDVVSVRRIPFHRPDSPDSAFLLPPVGGVDEAEDQRINDLRFEIAPADEDEALRYTRMAARNESDYAGTSIGDAEYLLAKFADEGVGRMMDHDRAVELLVRASQHGSYAAFQKLRTLPEYTVESARRRLHMKETKKYRRIGDGSGAEEDD